MHRYILHNDEVREAADTVLSPSQIGLLSGWGVFSTLRVARGVLFAFERHWARMQRDAHLLRVPFPSDPEYLHGRLLKLVEANRAYDATLRVAVVRNRGGMWEGPTTREWDLIALTAPLKNWGTGVRLGVAEQARHAASRFRGVKMLSWAPNLAFLEEAECRGFDEAILLNERGEVSECTSANIFVARDGAVWTPPLDSGCLPGVTRELLLTELAAASERVLTLDDIYGADEAFITSSTRDLLAVTEVEGRAVRQQGGARERLRAAFAAYLEAYVTRQAKASPTDTRVYSDTRSPT